MKHIKDAHFSKRGGDAMAAHKRSRGACGGGPSKWNGKGKASLEPYAKRMSMCVCVCVRCIHSKLPLKLERKSTPKMNTNAPFLLTMTPFYTKKVILGHLALIPTS